MLFFLSLFAQASAASGEVDRLFFFLLVLSTIITLVIVGAAGWFIWKYRAGVRTERGQERVKPSTLRRIELSWTLAALVLALGTFFWGASLYIKIFHTSTADALEINVQAKQWMWKFEHPSGRREINELHLPLGQNIRLIMTSEDVIHSFFVPAFRVKHDVVPRRVNILAFTPTMTGSFPILCAEYCGTEHSQMRATVVVVTPEEYSRWAGLPAGAGPVAEGAELYRQYGCYNCHEGVLRLGPKLDDLYGRLVTTEAGETLTVDEQYLHESIVEPGKRLHRGYGNNMPSYAGRLTDEQITKMIAYIKTLGAPGGEQRSE